MSAKAKGKAKGKRAKANFKINADVPSVGKGSMEFGLSTRNAMSVPAAMTRQVVQRGPSMISSGKGRDLTVVIKHREYLLDINGSELFELTQLSVNPGLPSTFPWLSSVSENFESYRFRRLMFTYETQAPTTDSGSLMMAMDYDAADTPPSTKSEMMVLQGATRTSVWSPMWMVCPSSDLNKFASKRFVRTSALSANLDIKTYDVGNFFVAVQGSGTTSIGELYVEYEVELQTPTWEGNDTIGSQSSQYYATSGTCDAPFSAFAPTVSGDLPVQYGGTTITLPRAGTYDLYVLTDTGFGGPQANNFITVDTGCVAYLEPAFVSGDGKYTQYARIVASVPGATLECASPNTDPSEPLVSIVVVINQAYLTAPVSTGPLVFRKGKLVSPAPKASSFLPFKRFLAAGPSTLPV